MDSMRYFAGADVAWAHGHVTQDGREVRGADIREGDEGVGLLAGNGLAAYYVFENGITAHYESYRGKPSGNYSSSRWFGFEVYGIDGIISLRNSPSGEMYLYPHGLWIPGEGGMGTHPSGRVGETPRRDKPRSGQEQMHLSNQMIVKELIQAIEEDRGCGWRFPVERMRRAALEMIMAVHESQRLKTRVSFPLKNRENPYKMRKIAWIRIQSELHRLQCTASWAIHQQTWGRVAEWAHKAHAQGADFAIFPGGVHHRVNE